MNMTLYGAKVIGKDEILYASTNLTDVTDFIGDEMMVVVKFDVTVNNVKSLTVV